MVSQKGSSIIECVRIWASAFYTLPLLPLVGINKPFCMDHCLTFEHQGIFLDYFIRQKNSIFPQVQCFTVPPNDKIDHYDVSVPRLGEQKLSLRDNSVAFPAVAYLLVLYLVL